MDNQSSVPGIYLPAINHKRGELAALLFSSRIVSTDIRFVLNTKRVKNEEVFFRTLSVQVSHPMNG